MPAVSLSCRVCATEHPLVATGTCTHCFGPLDPTYDWDSLRARVSRASIEAGPASIWRYADLLPVSAPEEARLAPGMTPLVPAPRLAEELGIGELWLKLDTANPTHSFKDRVVAVAARKAQELGLRHALLLVDGEPRRRGRGARGRRGPRSGRLRPERSRAREARCCRCLRAADLRRRRHLRPLLTTLGRAVVRAAVGVRQRQPALVLRRGIEDARLRDRRAARLGDAGRGRDPDRVGRALPQGRPGLRRARQRSASSTGRRRRSSVARRPAASPCATAFRDGKRVVPVRPDSIARSLAIGNPADGDFAVATARADGRRDLHGRQRTRSARTWPIWPPRPASSARPRRASRSVLSGRRSLPARSAARPASCCSSPATG